MIVKTYQELFGKPLTIRDIVDGYSEDTKTGKITAYGGKLVCNPPFQRAFIYEADAQKAVIHTVMEGFPLNVMYWAKCDNGTYELMDGQQRTVSICKFYNGEQVIDIQDKVTGKVRQNTIYDFDDDQKQQFLDYPVTVYICDGTETEKLNWFRVINIAGIKLTDQEMRNAVYSSAWVTDAKKYFSSVKGEGWASEGHTYNGHTYGDYVSADGGAHSEKETAVVRQKLLEIVLSWAADKYNRDNKLEKKDMKSIDDFMQINKSKPNALELWRYYEDVMEWVKAAFPTYRADMKKVEWGILYNKYHSNTPADADARVKSILAMKDDDGGAVVQNLKDVYEAVLSGDMNILHQRAFKKADMECKWNEQKHICPYCHGEFDLNQMQGDHIKPWSKGGLTVYSNLQMLCRPCNIKKSNYDAKYTPWASASYQNFDIDKWDKNY